MKYGLPIRTTACFLLACGMVGRCVWGQTAPPRRAAAQTTMLVNFEEGLDAAFASGNSAAKLDARSTDEHVRIVEGRFGKGVSVSTNAPGLALSYETKKHLDLNEGTIEFFFRPDWDWADAPEHVTLLSTYIGAGTGFRILKNQYGWFGFWYGLRYKTTARVITQYSRNATIMKAGCWTHIAVSWDDAEARLFVDGMLVSVSDRWEVRGEQYGRIALGGVVYGQGRGAGGTFDELRLSASKRYVASFTVPSAPLRRENGDREMAQARPTEGMAAKRLPFVADLAAQNWGSNRPLFEERCPAGKPLLRLRRNGKIGDVVFFPRPDALNRFLGRTNVRVRLSEPVQLPAVLLDASDIVFNDRAGGDRARRTGWQLRLTEDCRLQWQSLDDGSVVGQVQSAPLAVRSGEWRRFGVRWQASRTTLVYEGAEMASAVGQGIPSALPRYIYVGSRSTGQNTLDGWVSHVEIDRK
ncbi:MAG: hypothetical protein HN742_04115 [Lentisphaerae bacterium]|nr:hypothetical protein [Lentisphaerota bacterium]MBT4822099.1 hypothetical protein [Lentisphaerota bacterium]MBT5604850.1 hypothetical protein [Lentisphaerota bacterium]MBT7054231.1 hypothetical protein [Lentisphaerota bacterium]MBT7841028.1 hypothetical protein [Lentisphaerota bacterium]